MALERWIEQQQAQGNTLAVEMGRTLQKLYGDVSLNGQHPIEDKSKLNTPESVTVNWQTRWTAWGEKIGLNITVPEFPDTLEGLTEALKRGDKPIYVPQELSSQAQRHLLDKIWPKMQSHSTKEGNTVTNEVNHVGWRYTEYVTDAPHTNTTEKQLRDTFERTGREGLTVSEYIIAAQDAKSLEGSYLDQGSTWSRLLGSRREGGVVSADFSPGGALRVGWDLRSGFHHSYVGGRSSQGVVRA